MDELLAPSGNSINHRKLAVGENITGIIAGVPRIRQAKEYGTQKGLVWPSGDPIHEAVISIETASGVGTLYLSKYDFTSFRNAVRDLGITTFADTVGLALRLTREEDFKSEKSSNPRKVFKVQLKKV